MVLTPLRKVSGTSVRHSLLKVLPSMPRAYVDMERTSASLNNRLLDVGSKACKTAMNVYKKHAIKSSSSVNRWVRRLHCHSLLTAFRLPASLRSMPHFPFHPMKHFRSRTVHSTYRKGHRTSNGLLSKSSMTSFQVVVRSNSSV